MGLRLVFCLSKHLPCGSASQQSPENRLPGNIVNTDQVSRTKQRSGIPAAFRGQRAEASSTGAEPMSWGDPGSSLAASPAPSYMVTCEGMCGINWIFFSKEGPTDKSDPNESLRQKCCALCGHRAGPQGQEKPSVSMATSSQRLSFQCLKEVITFFFTFV